MKASSSSTVIEKKGKTTKPSARVSKTSTPTKNRAYKKSSSKKKATKNITTPKARTKAKKSNLAETQSSIVSPLSKQELLQIKRHPLGHLLLEKKLREAGFRGGVSTDKKYLEKYSTDESIFSIQPQVVVQPKSKQDVEIVTRLIASETKRFSSLSITPRAAGTGLSGGSLTDSIVMDVCTYMHHIESVVECKDKITITCEPGAMWRDVEKKLKGHNAYLPPYTSSKDICSIGGSIANNAAGPDSLRYGHCADWVESLDVVLADGRNYTLRPLTYKEFSKLIKEKNEYSRIAKEIFALIVKNEKAIENARPKTQKNSAGYALWDVISTDVARFKKGDGTFDLTRIISGSQGTIGIITSLTLRALPIQKNTTLITLPIFNLDEAASAIVKALEHNPINIEIFDALTFDLALKNPSFFKERLGGLDYYKALLSMYTTYHVRYGRQTPEFTILITLDEETTQKTPSEVIARKIKPTGAKARVVSNPIEAEMLWQIRRASYTLSKFQDPKKRPAAFLEDMTVPPENLSKFFIEIKKLFREFNVTSAVHGHGGNGHFHFYPLLDFTQKTTPLLVEKMAEKFYDTAVKYKGNICGEHNDGIIRTPHLSKIFTKQLLDIFKKTEAIFDPDDIFNPGKKVNPRFDIKSSIRKTN